MTNFPMTLGAAPLQAVLGDHAFVSSYLAYLVITRNVSAYG